MRRRAPVGSQVTRVSLTRPLTAMQLPPTVQGILAARMDRLLADDKALLQILSVIGKEFPLSLLTQVVGQPEAEVQGGLAHLQQGEFIYEQPAFPEPEYTFKHALTQDVAYNSLLLERRRALRNARRKPSRRCFRTGSRSATMSWPTIIVVAATRRRRWNTCSGPASRRCNGQPMRRRSTSYRSPDLLKTRRMAPLQQELVVQTTPGPAFIARW